MLLDLLEIKGKTEPHDYKYNLWKAMARCWISLSKKPEFPETFMVNKNAIFEGSGDKEITVFCRRQNTVVQASF